MNIKKLLLAMLLAVGLGGCASYYSDIRANGDGTYTLTHTKAGFFRVYGEVYRCTPQGMQKMVCQNIDRL